MKKMIPVLCAVVVCSVAAAKEKELIKGDIMEQFRPVKIWSLAGDVSAIDGITEFAVENGNTVLYNGTKKQWAPYLYTKDEFRDVKVRLEFMIPKGSNAGIYMFGRYEIQILDSYGKKVAMFYDLGGVYQRWRSKEEADVAGGEQGYEGVAPMVNAAKAPGEWQEMEIVFRAPRFDEAGKKTEQARFVSVYVNGQKVQSNVEVTGPTRAAPEQGDAERGPIVVQGDHGPIAIRSMRVTPLSLD